jgi:hypothetical protein
LPLAARHGATCSLPLQFDERPVRFGREGERVDELWQAEDHGRADETARDRRDAPAVLHAERRADHAHDAEQDQRADGQLGSDILVREGVIHARLSGRLQVMQA